MPDDLKPSDLKQAAPSAPALPTDQLIEALTNSLNESNKLKQRKPHEGMVVHGVDKAISESDAQVIAFAVMVEVTAKTDDRGEIPGSRPLYEIPLLRRMYARKGGECRVTADWLYHPKRKLEPMKPRTINLTRLDISFEMERLQKRFRLQTSSGPVSDFDKVYGTGVNNRFKKVVIEMAKLYKKINAQCIKEGRRINQDEIEQIAALGEPEAEGEHHLEVVSMDDTPQMSDADGFVVTDDDDPSFDLQTYICEKGHDPEIGLNMARLHAENRVNVDSLRTLPIVGGKKDMIHELMRDYKAWQASWAKRQKATAAT